MGGYIYNYASADNSVVDITGTSLQLLINFRDKNAKGPAVANDATAHGPSYSI